MLQETVRDCYYITRNSWSRQPYYKRLLQLSSTLSESIVLCKLCIYTVYSIHEIDTFYISPMCVFPLKTYDYGHSASNHHGSRHSSREAFPLPDMAAADSDVKPAPVALPSDRGEVGGTGAVSAGDPRVYVRCEDEDEAETGEGEAGSHVMRVSLSPLGGCSPGRGKHWGAVESMECVPVKGDRSSSRLVGGGACVGELESMELKCIRQ